MSTRQPALEDPFRRDGAMGYDPPSDVDRFVRCISHGAPSPLIRWHDHDDYELHFMVATHGRMFVGDYIGPFEPGSLVLIGPGLPHNWISDDMPPEGVPVRDHCIIFHRAPIDHAAAPMPELQELQPLLDRGARGVEFLGMADVARQLRRGLQQRRELQPALSRCQGDHAVGVPRRRASERGLSGAGVLTVPTKKPLSADGAPR